MRGQHPRGIDNRQSDRIVAQIMSDRENLLVIWHSRTGASEQMAHAAARHENARALRARDVRVDDLLRASAYLFAVSYTHLTLPTIYSV